MSIKAILERHRSLTEQTAKALSFATATPAKLRQPLTQQENHIGQLKRRIERLQQERGIYNKRVDDLIKELTQDVSAATTRLETDRKTLAPLGGSDTGRTRNAPPAGRSGNQRSRQPTRK